uniref:Uncharacterized protein n=1 Tax=Noctiluca scintillans TaxID=2966 RepID=A0A7S0ZY88_NOCSC
MYSECAGRGHAVDADDGRLVAERAALERLVSAHKRARRLGGLVTKRLAEATSELTWALQGVDVEASRLKRRDKDHSHFTIKYVPVKLFEFIPGLSPTSSEAASKPRAVSQLAQSCWEGWLRKHAALTTSEGIYASLLTDARRCDVLNEEISIVNGVLSEKRGDTEAEGSQVSPERVEGPGARHSPVRASAHDALRVVIATKSHEAIVGYKERTNNYLCGRTSNLTGYLRISRSPEDVDMTLKCFEKRVEAETEEALDQAAELMVAPNLQTLSETLSRRLEFWEGEIEKSWACWTAQSSEFHESCELVAEDWSIFHTHMRDIVAWAQEAAQPSSCTPPIVFIVPALNLKEVQAHKRWEEVHQVLATAAEVLALLGAWTDYHNLRGDGLALTQAADLFRDILGVLEKRFDGTRVVRKRLERNSSWRVVAPAAEAAASRGAMLWWCPRCWRHPLFSALTAKTDSVSHTLSASQPVALPAEEMRGSEI